ncbi:MAG TPA: selenium-binding protein SBP56-related protein [Egibacteraceae bacterium]|nr:selenium-binding protein SBP56-related protein [Egibacteraceae bacterium]
MTPAPPPPTSSRASCPPAAQPARRADCVQVACHPAGPPAAQRRAPDGRVQPRRQAPYLTNSLYRALDDQFYSDGIDSWMVKVDVADDGALSLDPDFLVDFSADGRCASPDPTPPSWRVGMRLRPRELRNQGVRKRRPVLDRGKIMVLWKNEEGVWKMHRHTWNSSVPPPET